MRKILHRSTPSWYRAAAAAQLGRPNNEDVLGYWTIGYNPGWTDQSPFSIELAIMCSEHFRNIINTDDWCVRQSQEDPRTNSDDRNETRLPLNPSSLSYWLLQAAAATDCIGLHWELSASGLRISWRSYINWTRAVVVENHSLCSCQSDSTKITYSVVYFAERRVVKPAGLFCVQIVR